MTQSVIVDSGFWIALHRPDDENHQAALGGLSLFRDLTPVTTWPVITEAGYLLAKYQGVETAAGFLDALFDGQVEVFDLERESLLSVAQLMRKYRDLPMDLADASLVLTADALGHGRILSTDRRDFGVYRWKSAEPFENLLRLKD